MKQVARFLMIVCSLCAFGAAGAPVREPNPDDNFILTEEMIPMRDGVQLHTLILKPKDELEELPILLRRTPYDSSKRLPIKQRTDLNAVMGPSLAELRGYIFVFQDIRGRNGSTGEFILARPSRGPFNQTQTDETTDAWDTIDWLVRHVPGNNGRVGIYGTSYDGWTTLKALLDPHPALKVAVPVNPAADFWMGDDWFHNGAFRPAYAFEYVYAMQTDRNAWSPFPFSQDDTYDWWLTAGSPDTVGQRYLDTDRHRYWTLLTSHPAYDAYWQATAVDRELAASHAKLIPTMFVHGLFDQEDIYGATASYAATASRDKTKDHIFLVAGPWFHGQNWTGGAHLGAIEWSEDTARHWREDMLAPFLAHYLKDAPVHTLAPISVFNTGTHRWERFASWPKPEGTKARDLYLQPDHRLAWHASAAAVGSVDAFISDPSKPVPYQPRPVRRIYDDDAGNLAWRSWLVADQRFVDGRPDVLSYVGETLKESITIRGAITADIFAETSGSDADWVVKVIDIYPRQDAAEPEMSSYELMISGDILRGRYREGFDRSKAIIPNQPLEYRWQLPQVNHTFKAGHRIMVQIQSSWFPLYDRNPQSFVVNLMAVTATDFRTAVHKIHLSSRYPSHVEVQVANGTP